MKLVNATVSLYRVPTHMKQPISNALQRIEAVELVVVRLFADNGVDGWGYTYTIGKGGSAIKCILETELVPLVMGENPLNSERIWQKLWWVCRVISRAGITTMGIAAIDNALWDLKGKHFGEPLYRLLGGYRDRVPAYAMDSGWMDLSLEEMKSLSKKLVKEGFKGVKIKVGRESSEQDLERVKEARSAVGNNVQVMIDANGRFTIDEATRLTNLLKDFDISWFEEPFTTINPKLMLYCAPNPPFPLLSARVSTQSMNLKTISSKRRSISYSLTQGGWGLPSG